MKKMISTSTFVFLFTAFMLPALIHAQGLSIDEIKAQLVKDWERAKTYTVDYLNTMPADKYSFKAVDSIRSFAQQMLHLAATNYFLMSMATDQQAPAWAQFSLENNKTAQNKDSVMYYVTKSYEFCRDAVKNCDPKKWGEKKTIFGFEETKFALMQKAFEHQGHHRGQTTIYIRLQGIKPPEERLFGGGM